MAYQTLCLPVLLDGLPEPVETRSELLRSSISGVPSIRSTTINLAIIPCLFVFFSIFKLPS